jgi:spore germination protein YaaH
LRELKDENMLMTCAVVSNWLNYSSDWQRYFDYINVMSYDHDSFTSTPVQHASYDHFVSDLNYWVNQYGTPKNKIIGGLPFYGYTWDEGVQPDAVRSIRFHGVISAFDGKYNLTATDIADKDNVSKTYYNGRITIGRKCMYVLDNDFAGVMIWQLFQDAYEDDLQLIKVVGEKIGSERL